MKTTAQLAAAATFACVAFAEMTALGNFGNCVSSCFRSLNGAGFQNICSSQVSNLASCINSSPCSESDKSTAYALIAQNCQSNGVNLATVSPYSSYFSNGNIATTITNGPFAGASSYWVPTGTISSAWSSYTSAHPNGASSSDWSSFTSRYSITNGPWGGATPVGGWGSWATNGAGSNQNWGGGGYGFGMGHGGWQRGNGGPFNGNWGAWGSTGAWTNSPWTSWWNGDSCPSSTWSGWTSGSWSTAPQWTQWTACTATPTSTSVYTTTINGIGTVTSSLGFRVAQATSTSSSNSGSTNRNAAAPQKVITGGGLIAGLLGVIAAL